MSELTSSGRGGAGNIVERVKSPKIEPKDLETPTLKTSVVTTGRGGTGNMAKNTDPIETRARQDVEPVTRQENTGATHVGRGGGGNVFNPKADQQQKEGEAAKDLARTKSNTATPAAAAATAPQDSAADAKKPEKESLASKGKKLLGLGKK